MSHHLTIAKATFAASLLRPDVTKVNRDDLPQFHQKLEEVVLKCTPSTIQNCKQWLLEHVIPSAQRSAAFGRYLSAYSRYLSKPDTQNGPCISRQRLHLIYLLNDILHHAKHHTTNPTVFSASPSPFEPILHELFRDAASEQRRGTSKRLEDILSIWEQNEYLPRSLWLQLNAAVTDPASAETAQQPSHTSSLPKETPYMMPFMHGDPSLPFYELPAGNFIPHILPSRKISMRPDSIKPLQFAAGPADDALVNAVKDFLKDVERIDPTQVIEAEGIVADIDDLGQLSYRNEAGDVVEDTYYGWSQAFCNRMKSRNRSQTNGSRERSRSRSYSRSRSRGPRLGKRRYSRSSSDQSRSRSRSRLRNRSFADYQRSERESRTPSPRRFTRPAIDEPSKIASDQFSHQTTSVTGPAHTYPGFTPFQPPPLVPGNVPVPPPRPPNWPAGAPWPPPPPPPPAGRSNGFPLPLPHPPGQHHTNPGHPPVGPYYR